MTTARTILAVAGVLVSYSLAVSSPLHGLQKGCRETLKPKKLPAPSSLVDSAKAVTDLAVFGTTSPAMLFSLVFNENDSLPHIRGLENTDPLAAVALLRAVRPQPPSKLWAIRVRVVEGGSPVLTLEHSIYCPPIPSDNSAPQMFTIQVEGSERIPASGRVTVHLEALISEDGQAIQVRVTQTSGVRDIDDQMVQEFHRRRFKPAMLDGKPIEGIYRSDGEAPRL